MFENIMQALQGVWSHKMRSFLTMLGIIIGIASIIVIVSTIKGTNEVIKANLVGSGNNVAQVQLYQDANPYEMQYGTLPAGVRVISEDTRMQLEALGNVEGVSLFHLRDYADNVFYRSTAYTGSVYGIDSRFFQVYGYRLISGRSFVQSDFDRFGKVVILDTSAVDALAITGNPLGQTVEINREPYVIVGIAALSDSFRPVIETVADYNTYIGSGSQSAKIFMPDACWPIVYRFDEPQTVAVKAKSTDEMTNVGKAAAEVLTQNQIYGENSKFSYKAKDLLEQVRQLQNLSSSTNRQLVWIASISLLVGGIGVMNIMLVSVTERTGEIGLKKAIGAKRRRILAQFLTEAAVLTSLGGVLGVAGGIGLSVVLSKLTGTPSAVSVPAILIAVVFSMLIGLIFGLLPAVKASKLSPIQALRRE